MTLRRPPSPLLLVLAGAVSLGTISGCAANGTGGGDADADGHSHAEPGLGSEREAIALGDVGYGDVAKMAWKVLELNKSSLPPDLAKTLFPEPFDYHRMGLEFAEAARQETYVEYAAKLAAYHTNMHDAELLFEGNHVWADARQNLDAVRQQVNETSQQFARQDLERRALASYVASQQLKLSALQKVIDIDRDRPASEPSRAEGYRRVMRSDLETGVKHVTRVRGDIVTENAMRTMGRFPMSCSKQNAWCDRDGCTRAEYFFDDPVKGRQYFGGDRAACESSRDGAWPDDVRVSFSTATAPFKGVDTVLASWRDTLAILDKDSKPFVTSIAAAAIASDIKAFVVSPWLEAQCLGRAAPCVYTPSAETFKLPAAGLRVSIAWTCSKDTGRRHATVDVGRSVTLDCEPQDNLIVGATKTDSFGRATDASTCNGKPECSLTYKTHCPHVDDTFTWTCSKTGETRTTGAVCFEGFGMDRNQATATLACPQSR